MQGCGRKHLFLHGLDKRLGFKAMYTVILEAIKSLFKIKGYLG